MTAQAPALYLRRDRRIVLAALGLLSLICWAYVLWLASNMAGDGMEPQALGHGSMDMSTPSAMAAAGMLMPAVRPWSAAQFVTVYLMWAIMMAGMMTPSVTPMVLLYARVGRSAQAQHAPFASVAWFAGGYLFAWCVFSLVATAAQWVLDRGALLSSMMSSTSDLFGAAVLIIAGLYQWTPLKRACLSACQSPLAFLQLNGGFRSDRSGALILGFRHGAYCIGCCWALMVLLFVGGVMNVLWIAALMALVLAEKLLPHGDLLARAFGLVFIGSGLALVSKVV